MTTKQLLTLRLLVIAGIIFLVDQATKYIIRATIDPLNIKEIITNFFYITNNLNTGFLLGLLSGNYITIFLVNFTVVITILVIYYKQTIKQYNTELILLVGAGISNLYDRIALRGVVDWMGINNFSVFNIADIIITLGILSIIIRQFLKETKETKKNIYKKLRNKISK